MAFFTYDAEADVLYVHLTEDLEAPIKRTEEVSPNLHVDLDEDGRIVGVEFLYPRSHGFDPGPIRERYGIELEIPFSFAA